MSVFPFMCSVSLHLPISGFGVVIRFKVISLVLSGSLSALHLEGCAGVAAGGHPGVLCAGPGLRLGHRLLLLQPPAQQLPPRRHHGGLRQLHDLCAGFTGRLHRTRLQGQENGNELRQTVSACVRACARACVCV